MLPLWAWSAVLAGAAASCIESSYEFHELAGALNYSRRELEVAAKKTCGARCGMSLTVRWDMAVPTVRVSHRIELPIMTDAGNVSLLLAPELPTSLAAQWICDGSNISNFACRQLQDIGKRYWPEAWCPFSKGASRPSWAAARARALLPDDEETRAATLCDYHAAGGGVAGGGARCEGVYLTMAAPSDRSTHYYHPRMRLEAKVHLHSPRDDGGEDVVDLGVALRALGRAGKGCEIPNFKGSYLGRFPLVLADFWTSDHLSERSRP